MAYVEQLKSGRFRAMARHKACYESSTFDRRDEAERWAEATEARMKGGKWRRPVVAKAVVRTVAQAYDEYRKSESYLSLAETTRRADKHRHKPVIDAIGEKRLADLTEEDVLDYIAKRRKTPTLRHPDRMVSGDAIRLEVASLAAVCSWAVEKRLIPNNPTRGVKRPATNRRTGRLSDALIGAIMRHPKVADGGKVQLFFRLLFSTVCRPGELATARRQWYRKDPPQIALPRTKNEDERAILIPDALADEFDAYFEMDDWAGNFEGANEYIFATRGTDGTWRPFNYSSIWRVVARDLGIAGEVVPHMSRHEGVSRLFERTNLSDGQIAAVSGHRSPQSLWRYRHLRAEHARGVVNALDNLFQASANRQDTRMKPGEMLQPIHPDIPRRKRGSALETYDGVAPKLAQTSERDKRAIDHNPVKVTQATTRGSATAKRKRPSLERG